MTLSLAAVLFCPFMGGTGTTVPGIAVTICGFFDIGFGVHHMDTHALRPVF
jgi:hypothetical protein